MNLDTIGEKIDDIEVSIRHRIIELFSAGLYRGFFVNFSGMSKRKNVILPLIRNCMKKQKAWTWNHTTIPNFITALFSLSNRRAIISKTFWD